MKTDVIFLYSFHRRTPIKQFSMESTINVDTSEDTSRIERMRSKRGQVQNTKFFLFPFYRVLRTLNLAVISESPLGPSLWLYCNILCLKYHKNNWYTKKRVHKIVEKFLKCCLNAKKQFPEYLSTVTHKCTFIRLFRRKNKNENPSFHGETHNLARLNLQDMKSFCRRLN